MELFVREDSLSRAALAGAGWRWEGNTLHIQLRANGKKALEACVPGVCRSLAERFAAQAQVEIHSGENLEGAQLFAAMEQMRQDMMESIPQPGSGKAPEKAQPQSQQAQQSQTIYGKPFQGKPIPMSEVDLNQGFVIVEGKVFHVEHKELKKNNAWVINFDMTDYTGSVRVNRYMDNNEAKPILEAIREGSVIQVKGKPTENRYDNEMVLKPFGIMPGSMPKRQDTATEGKRVELHLHTTMSNMDALTNTAEAVKQAAAWGHRAIAITDHGCVQSFPDAMKAASKAKVAGTDENIKILYGCEGYYVNDVDDRVVVHGSADMEFDGEYVAFDLETTGLSSQKDEIIEIGAVRMQGGKELDRFQTFVNPGRRLEQKIVELTGITDAMLADAPSIEKVLPEFLEFVGDRVLVAHNADFDTGFIREACRKQGLPYGFTSVDTLILSQNLLPHLNKFKLDVVSNALSLPDFNHHRAGDDAVTCGLIFHKLTDKLRELELSRLQEINPAMMGLRSQSRIDNRHARHIILFAKNQVGLRNLYHLISDANLKYFKRVPRIPKSELLRYREGLIIGSACEAGELFQAILDNKCEDEVKRLAEFYDFLEVQPLANNAFMLAKGIVQTEEELREFNRKIVRLGEALGKPVVATGDVHFLNPEDEIFRHILLATKGFEDCDRSNPLYFRTTDDMLREFSYLGEEKAKEIVITNPNLIADMCETLRPVPHNLFAPKIENSVEDLKSLVYGKLHRLYGENPPELITKRVETELHDIISCHYDVIYMSAQKLVQNSLEHGYLVGSRGSVGSSIVAYMSGITEVNSFPPHYRCPNPDCKYTTFQVPKGCACGADLPDAVCPKCGATFEKDGFNIPFETFLGFGGDKVPDIDLNFSGEYQSRAHAYCVEMFGKSHVFRAGTVGTVAEKTAFGYVKKYLSERGKHVGKAEEMRLATGCVGVRRTTGQHPGGLVVIPQENEIWDFCPVQHPADDPNSDQITTHFEYHSMEENLLKLDMLGHDDPTMIRMMEDVTGVDAKTIPLDDKDTMSIFTSSKVLGYEDDPTLGPTGAVAIPEFNTHFTRGMLLDTMPTRFDTLVRLSGFSHGTDVWLGNAKDLILSKTATVDSTIGCRDDIMTYLISCGMPEKRSFKIMEAVRKGRGLPEGAEEEMREAGVPEWYIGSCKKIKYLFPKAHAVAYVMMAFRIAWFKVHHPLAFYAAYFYRRSQKGGFDAVLMTGGIEAVKANIQAINDNEEATDKDEDLLTTLEVVYEYYLRGFDFLPIDLYESHAIKFLIKDGKILPPFVAISGLGESAAWDLMRGREGKHFLSIEEVAAACPKVSKTHMQMLGQAGAFGDLPDTSQVSLF
ncbi:MAG TPA: PolC-type DNA polymerase III [Candidatus Faecousia excrementigallinarum]|uniref:DNA polymerase III PolC-type n=1 Tax=Candidatus Faecousia excrementigallinarum TaxID=2840806 RepID=A0A9D1CM25_9FIRM|nr:PolC-type DNA polymerase III [Candidatus Faecousia excrementigallinarum]